MNGSSVDNSNTTMRKSGFSKKFFEKAYLQEILKSPNLFGLVPFVILVCINSITHNVEPALSSIMMFLIGLIKQFSGFVILLPVFKEEHGGAYFLLTLYSIYVVWSYFETMGQACVIMLTHKQITKLETKLGEENLEPKNVPFIKGRVKDDGSYYNLTVFNLLLKISKPKIDWKKFIAQLALAYILASTSGNFMERYAPSGNPTSAATNLIQEMILYGPTGGRCEFLDPKNTSGPAVCWNDKDPTRVDSTKYKGPRYRTEPKLIIPFVVLFFLFSSTFWEGKLLEVELEPRIDKPKVVESQNKYMKYGKLFFRYFIKFIIGISATENVVTSAESMLSGKSSFFDSLIMHFLFLVAWFCCGLIPMLIEEDLLTYQEANRNALVTTLKKQVEDTATKFVKKRYYGKNTSPLSLIGKWCKFKWEQFKNLFGVKNDTQIKNLKKDHEQAKHASSQELYFEYFSEAILNPDPLPKELQDLLEGDGSTPHVLAIENNQKALEAISVRFESVSRYLNKDEADDESEEEGFIDEEDLNDSEGHNPDEDLGQQPPIVHIY